MTSNARRLYDEAMSLPEAERRLLGAALLESVDEASDDEIDPEWRDEVLRRVEQVRSGEVVTESWSEVRRQIRQALGR